MHALLFNGYGWFNTYFGIQIFLNDIAISKVL